MTFAEILLIFLIALFVASLFFYGFRKRIPFGTFWIFLLLTFLAAWSARLWITPIGPVAWGIAWIPILFFVLVFGVILAAALWSANTARKTVNDEGVKEAEEPKTGVGLNIFFWIVIIFLVLAIISGYIEW